MHSIRINRHKLQIQQHLENFHTIQQEQGNIVKSFSKNPYNLDNFYIGAKLSEKQRFMHGTFHLRGPMESPLNHQAYITARQNQDRQKRQQKFHSMRQENTMMLQTTRMDDSLYERSAQQATTLGQESSILPAVTQKHEPSLQMVGKNKKKKADSQKQRFKKIMDRLASQHK